MKEQERIRREKALQPMHDEERKRQLGHRFHRIHHLIDRFFANSWEHDERELTRAQCSTLHYLYDHREIPIFQKDIEAAFSVTGATATNLLKGLERQGIVERVAVEEDARLKRIILTEEAVRFHERALRNMERLEGSLVAGMSVEETDAYRAFLERTIKNLELLVGEQRANEECEK